MAGRITQVTFGSPQLPRDKNVAAYCRVSSGKDAMRHSLAAQVSYYSELIQNHAGWEYAGVYADEAVTGTRDSRKNFRRLLSECRAGKIDMVITKSISRFARNTVTLLETVRELKTLGVDVYFEEQNIHSLSADGELMLTILASYAQEESRSASENQKWRIKKNFEEGKPWSSTLLGYRNVNGRYEIVPEEAETVRMIFAWYLEGAGATTIRNRLNAMGIKTRLGNSWSRSPILKLLRNYAYTGNLILQTTYREDYITKRSVKNNGEKPMYHAQGTHEAIIDMDTFSRVQEEIQRRAEHFASPDGNKSTTRYPFTSMVKCSRCGKSYVRSGSPKYRKRKRFADGKVSLAYSTFLGYKKGEDGKMEIVPEEAETVRLIYRMFMQGKTPYAIAKYLTEQEIPTPTGKSGWRHRTVENILTNEKYKGDARLQKCYTVDFLSKKRKANEGEVPQYYVEGSHDAIISPSEWQLVQLEMERRRASGRSNCCSPFSAKLKCGDCGAYFGSKVWHSNSKYKRTVWQCNAKFKGEHKCTTPHLYEQRIQELFLEALSSLMENRDCLIDDCRAVMHVLGDCKAIDREMDEVRSEMEVTTGLIQKLIDENATRKMDQNDYRKRYDGYVSRYAVLESRMDSLEKERKEREFKYDIFSGFLFELGEIHELPLAFDDRLFYQLVDYATVYSDGRVAFTFRNGTEITTEM